MSPAKEAIATLYDALDTAKRLNYNDAEIHFRATIRRVQRQRKKWRLKNREEVAA